MHMASKKTVGAHVSHVSIKARCHSTALEHRRIFIDSLRRLIAQPIATFMTCAVIAIALALPVTLYVALENAQALSKRWDGETQIAVFLQADINEVAAQQLAEKIKQWPEIAAVNVISKAQGMAEFEQLTGMQEVLASLEKNPLPVVLEVQPKAEFAVAEKVEKIVQQLQVLPESDQVKLDLEWVKRLQAILQMGESIVFALVLMLSSAVLLVIANTIRLEIENRRREISVIKLIGGTDGFIRRPFLYAGFWYGLGSGILASIMVALVLMAVNPKVAQLAGLYHTDYALLALSMSDILSLWMIAALLGYSGAWFTVNRHLDQLDIS